MPEPGWGGVRVHTNICARCGCDRAEQRRGKFRCSSWGQLYNSHIWGWVDPEHGQPNHSCGSCDALALKEEASDD